MTANNASGSISNRPSGHDAHDFATRLMEHLVVPTFALDPQGRVIIWNLACAHLTGIEASAVMGTSNHWRGFYEEPRPTLADLVVQGRSKEMSTYYEGDNRQTQEHSGLSAENWCAMPQSGTRLFLAIDAGPIFDHDGNLAAVVETLRDMTGKKQAQLALEQLAAQDGLTGLANRRSFDIALIKELHRAERESRPLSLLMIDVDFFKKYNDKYGHPAGDNLLKQVANTIIAAMRRGGDTTARYGGEEFAVILPSESLEKAAIVAERIRSAVEQLVLPGELSPCMQVTVSIGVATVDVFPAKPQELVALADAALYRAKDSGRNCIRLALT